MSRERGESGVCIVGGGAWGTALAVHAARCGFPVRLWIREPEIAEQVTRDRENRIHLPGVKISSRVQACAELGRTLLDAQLVIVAVPSPFAREVYSRMRPDLAADATVVLATKGIEEGTLALPTEVAREELGPAPELAVLSGPSFAGEVARALPTAVVVAGETTTALRIQQTLSSAELRLYTNVDSVGVQLAGAVKNVMAVAAGVADGLGMGSNTQAALITRGLSEITRLGVSLGGAAETFSGLAGLGDLTLTCGGEQSRNRQVGQGLGRGRPLAELLEATHSFAEGVRTTRSTRDLAHRQGVSMPIVEEMFSILYEGVSPRDCLRRLMSRRPTAENLIRGNTES